MAESSRALVSHEGVNLQELLTSLEEETQGAGAMASLNPPPQIGSVLKFLCLVHSLVSNMLVQVLWP